METHSATVPPSPTRVRRKPVPPLELVPLPARSSATATPGLFYLSVDLPAVQHQPQSPPPTSYASPRVHHLSEQTSTTTPTPTPLRTSISSSQHTHSPASLFFDAAPPTSPAFTAATSLPASHEDDAAQPADHKPTSPRTCTKGKGRRLTKPRPPPPPPPFEPDAPLTLSALERAAALDVLDESGAAVPFGSLFYNQRTVVCFIRHFWCPMCQDYVSSVVRSVPPSLLSLSGVKLLIVSNGSPRMIAAYRRVLRCPFPIYTDPSRALYAALGMTRRTLSGGPASERGEYVEHGAVGGVVMVLRNAMEMPLANSGDLRQLGGEFCLGPGLTSNFAHRMPNTRAHAPVLTALAAAGVTLPAPQPLTQSEADASRLAAELAHLAARPVLLESGIREGVDWDSFTRRVGTCDWPVRGGGEAGLCDCDDEEMEFFEAFPSAPRETVEAEESVGERLYRVEGSATARRR